MNKTFIIIPSLSATGPIKGALALCNELAKHMSVTLVVIKSIEEDGLIISPLVKVISLGSIDGWRNKISKYISLLQEESNNHDVVSISYCFSADFLNYFASRYVKTISSVRGNLAVNYKYDYGFIGYVIAFIQFQLLKRFDLVLVMSESMSNIVKKYGIKKIEIIGNFIDEQALDRNRIALNKRMDAQHTKFVFLASLSERKRPELLINAILKLVENGDDVSLDIIGDGPLRAEIEGSVDHTGGHSVVKLHGHLPNPYRILQEADIMVLPSESEGISRAVLEALYLGIPCVLRDVDANSEIIEEGKNGWLFKNDEELFSLLKRIISDKKKNFKKISSLLPIQFQQETNINKILELLRA